MDEFKKINRYSTVTLNQSTNQNMHDALSTVQVDGEKSSTIQTPDLHGTIGTAQHDNVVPETRGIIENYRIIQEHPD